MIFFVVGWDAHTGIPIHGLTVNWTVDVVDARTCVPYVGIVPCMLQMCVIVLRTSLVMRFLILHVWHEL